MSITTFDALIASGTSRKVFLVEVEPSEMLDTWTLSSGSIYYQTIGQVHVLSVYQNTVALAEVATLALVTAGKWFYDGATGRLYVRATSSTVYGYTFVANYRLYFSSDTDKTGAGVILQDRFYEPVVKSTPRIEQSKQDLFWGLSTVASGEVQFWNDNGRFDTIYDSYAWPNKTLRVLLGGEDLPYSEYRTMFQGPISDKAFSTDTFALKFVDKKTDLKESLPARVFLLANYPSIEAANIGRPIPLVFGSVYRMPALCINGLATGTSNFLFKYADTALGSVGAPSKVFVNDVQKTIASSNASKGLFKLASTAYSAGNAVTVDCNGYYSGTVLIENPVDVVKKLLNEIGIAYTSAVYDTALVSVARSDATVFPVGYAVTDFTPALTVIGDLMKSCMGTLYVTNAGKYSVVIWKTDLPTAPTVLDENDIVSGSMRVESSMEDVRRTVRVGWRKEFGPDKWSYKQQESNVAQYLYGVTRSKTVTTFLSTEAGVTIYLGRMQLLLERSTTRVTFKTKAKLADHNVGDRIQVSFKRREGDDDLAWLSSRTLEILEIRKLFAENEVEVSCGDMRGIGGSVGHWTSDTPTFPATIGGGSAAVWDPAWSSAKKAYALANFGYWTDDNGFIDATDGDSLNKSRWW